MQTLKLIGGFAIFIPLFFVAMWLPSTLTSRGRSGLAWLAWLSGLGGVITIIVIYGRLIR